MNKYRCAAVQNAEGCFPRLRRGKQLLTGTGEFMNKYMLTFGVGYSKI